MERGLEEWAEEGLGSDNSLCESSVDHSTAWFYICEQFP